MRIIEADAPVLESARLIIRPLRVSDLDAIYASVNHWPAVRYTSSIPYPCDPSDVLEYIHKSLQEGEDGDSSLLGAEDRSTGQYVGQVGLTYALETQEAELSYLLDPRVQGKGFATEAARTIMAWGFQERTLDAVFARVFVPNTASHRVLARLGFRRTGTQDIYARARGRTVTVFRYRLERQDFEETIA